MFSDTTSCGKCAIVPRTAMIMLIVLSAILAR